METEIKIRLPSEEATSQLEQALGGNPTSSEDQENVFFDGVHRELIKNQLVFRIRVIERPGKDPIGVVALKGNAILIDGIASVEEYPHGTAYEVEIESADPVKAKERMTSLLKEHDIEHDNSLRNKFDNMLHGTLD
ncbi:hypothetical protein EDD11_008891 [Mortierella claussenii]|nr:hypothetical protein EDD11_008891 [Mortierella claussenii]